MYKTLILLALSGVSFSAHATTPPANDSLLNHLDRHYRVSFHLETGFLAPLEHTIQFGVNGSEIDYRTDGAQDNLFPFIRFSADVDLGDRHTIVFLAQPLDIRTRAVLARDLVIDGLTFPQDTAVDFRYGFTFYRGSYLYDLIDDSNRELAVGFSLQIRNATIGFTSADGRLSRVNRDIGPVPVLKARGRRPLGSEGWWIAGEADGFYAPIKYLNGDDSDVVGAILDASLMVGASLSHGAEAFVSLRYIAGGSEGTADEPTYPSDGYTSNWLHFLTLSLGVNLR